MEELQTDPWTPLPTVIFLAGFLLIGDELAVGSLEMAAVGNKAQH